MSGPSLIIARASGDFDTTLGALLIGGLLAVTIWGITCVQTFDYFLAYSDGPVQKSIIGLLWIIDALGSVMISQFVYNTMVTNYLNPEALASPTWGMSYLPVVGGLSFFIVRTMFALRIYSLSGKNVILIASIMVLAIADLALDIATTAVAARGMLQNLSKILYPSFVLGCACDIIIAISLCWLLHSTKSGFRRTDSLVAVLMLYVVNTGLLVAIAAALAMITYCVMPNTLISYIFYLPLGKLYFNAYLASLNARVKKKNSGSSVQVSRLDVGHSKSNHTQSADDKTNTFHNPKMAITFETSVERRIDDYGIKSPVV